MNYQIYLIRLLWTFIKISGKETTSNVISGFIKGYEFLQIFLDLLLLITNVYIYADSTHKSDTHIGEKNNTKCITDSTCVKQRSPDRLSKLFIPTFSVSTSSFFNAHTDEGEFWTLFSNFLTTLIHSFTITSGLNFTLWLCVRKDILVQCN